jgi:hypothetical protein
MLIDMGEKVESADCVNLVVETSFDTRIGCPRSGPIRHSRRARSMIDLLLLEEG